MIAIRVVASSSLSLFSYTPYDHRMPIRICALHLRRRLVNRSNNRGKESDRRNPPSIISNRERIASLNTMPILNGIPLPEPEAIVDCKMSPLTVYYRKHGRSMVNPLIHIHDIDLLLFLGGIDIGRMNAQAAKNRHGVMGDGPRRNLRFRSEQRTGHTVEQGDNGGGHR